MSSYKSTLPRYQYKKAPLQEAIFEAKFSYENFDSALPGQFYEKVKTSFPDKNDLNVITIVVGTTSSQTDVQPTYPQIPLMQAWNAERSGCLQIGPGIITANEKKYQSWEKFTQSIKLLLNSYFDCIRPVIAKKIGIRCINRFLIPTDNVKLSDYFNIGLALPELLSGSSSFDITLTKESSYDTYDLITKIRFTTDPLKLGEAGVAFILDIDSFIVNNIPTDSKGILSIATLCHHHMKDLFESILNDKTRSLLEGYINDNLLR